MPGFHFPGRPGGEHDERLLDMILSGRTLPPHAPRETHDLARVLAALGGPAEPGELAGEAIALAAFGAIASPARISPPAPPRTARHRMSRHRTRSRARMATVLVAAAAGLGGAAAVYTGVLAHTTAGPPASHSQNPQPSAVPGSLQGTGHRARPASQPASRPGRPGGTATKPGGASTSTSRRGFPLHSQGPSCTPTAWPWPRQSPPWQESQLPVWPSQPQQASCSGTTSGRPGQGGSPGTGRGTPRLSPGPGLP